MKKLLHSFIIGMYATAYAPVIFAEPPMAPFYAAVIKMAPEGKLGQVIKQEKVATSVKGAQAWRIAYISSDVSGRKTISTGIVVSPVGVAPLGGRPVMSWVHGTTGTAQNCGPSQVINPADPLNEYFLINGNSYTDYGIPAVEEFIKEGYVIVSTDNQGLGGGGRHQYGVAVTNGMDAINAARAANSMRQTGGNNKAIIYGWSTGAGAAIAIAGMPDYIKQTGTAADHLDIKGFVALAPQDVAALAPASQFDQASADKYFAESQKMFLGNVFDFTHATMFYWGTQAAFPELNLNDIFTDEGVKVVNQIYGNKCMHPASATLNFLYGSTYASLIKEKPTNTLAWTQAMMKGSVPRVKPVAPVQIYYGTKDVVAAPMLHKIYQEQMCKLGGNVGRMQLPGEQTHFTTPPTSQPFYVQWVKDRFANKSLENACPQN